MVLDQNISIASEIYKLLCYEPFTVLNEDEINILCKRSRIISFSRDDILYTQGEENFTPMYIVSGQVKLCCSASHGRECVLHIIRQKNIIDVGVLFYEAPVPYSAVGITNGQAVSLDKEYLLYLCETNSIFSLKILKIMSARQRLFINKLAGSQGKISVSCRVASWILHRSKMEESDEISVDINRELLARLLGITRESLSRELSRLKSLKYIETTKRQIQILDRQALQKISTM